MTGSKVMTDDYCPKCGKTTRQTLRKGLYAASADYLECNECGRMNEVGKNIEQEIRERRRKTWTKKGFEELYGKGSYNKVPDFMRI